MAQLTAQDVISLLTRSAGDLEFSGDPADALDLPFDTLGCDSLALLETAARIQDDYGVALPEEVVGDLDTPRALMAAVNEAANQGG
ncbi:acyl carrier protein [Streptomyces catenulae]|uniref:Acyl carrier protein n=1 Tax=Streptomyces catenulae TaxID=66875 RepID=A0ABV2YZB7_9ACTN|nr:acyl carrier protein [Streptomyces catenulae]